MSEPQDEPGTLTSGLLPIVRRYALATALVAAAWALRLALDPVLGDHGPFLLFLVAVAGSAWAGDFLAGAYAAGLSATAALWFFVDPRHSITLSTAAHAVYLVVFLTEALTVCFIARAMHWAERERSAAVERDRRARAAAEESAVAARSEVARRQETEAELRKSNYELQQFASVISHDLKAPLHTIRSHAESILAGTENPAASSELILSAVDRTAMLIDDLLAYAALGRGGVRSETAASLTGALDWVCANLAGLIRETGASITCSDLPCVKMDFARLAQLLQNLIGNGIKYRSAERPEIHISASADGDFWVFSVRDNGIGIDPRYAEGVFEPFKRLHGSELPGTGIGLAICRRIVEKIGGRIWVQPAEGGGSDFRFTVPADVVVSDGGAGRRTFSVAERICSSPALHDKSAD